MQFIGTNNNKIVQDSLTKRNSAIFRKRKNVTPTPERNYPSMVERGRMSVHERFRQ
jgi:hypothetical protein